MTTLTFTRAVLLPALAAATKAVQTRNTIPILSNVLVEPGEGAAWFTATDLDLSVRAACPCVAVSGPAKGFTVPGHLLHDIVRKLPDGAEITLALDGAHATVASGRSRFRLHVIPKADFPQMQGPQGGAQFALDGAQLSRMLGRTAFAISSEETRYYLNGVFWHVRDERLIAVATDGHRLARHSLPAPDGADGMPGIIVPSDTVNKLRALAEGEIAVTASDRMIRFAFGAAGREVEITSKLIDGTFPDYVRVIPAGNANRHRVNVAALKAAVDRVTTLSSEKARPVKLAFGDGRLALAVSNRDAGDGNDEIDAEQVEGAPVEIGFNARYLADMLGACPGSTIDFVLGSAGDPARAFPAAPDENPAPEEETDFVLMPMRV